MDHTAFQVALAFAAAAILITDIAPNWYARAAIVMSLLWHAIPGVPPEPLFFLRWAVSTAAFTFGIIGMFAKLDRV